ncbi:MAG: biopolymer transporter ExbD [Acidobacteriota bacterium]
MAMEVGSTSKVKSEPNVVPLCDILLVLLIIFMVITPLVQKGIDVKLPETGGSDTAVPASTIVLTLKKDLNIDVNQRPIQRAALAQYLKELYATRADKTIFIRADSRLPYKEVIKIIDIAKGAGIEVLGIVPEIFQE